MAPTFLPLQLLFCANDNHAPLTTFTILLAWLLSLTVFVLTSAYQQAMSLFVFHTALPLFLIPLVRVR